MSEATPAESIVEKVTTNRPTIIKRTLLIAGGIIGATILAGFLSKKRFPAASEDVIVVDIPEETADELIESEPASE